MLNHETDISELVPAVLEAAGLPTVLEITREPGGIANHVYRVGRDYIVRLGTGSDGKEFHKTACVLQAIEGRVKAQKLIFADFTTFEYPVMVCEYVPGTALKALWPSLSDLHRRDCMRQFLAELQHLHGIDWRALDAFEADLDWPTERERQILVSYSRLKADVTVDKELVERYYRYFEQHRDHLHVSGPPVLIHGDANITNVVFDDNLELQALIDFDDAEVAPAEVEYWNMTFELLDEGTCSLAQIKGWLKDYYPFDDPHALVRLKLSEVHWNLMYMGIDLSWRSARTSRLEAAEDYQEIFAEDSLSEWFPRLPGAARL